VKGLITGVLIGWFAKKVSSLPLGILFGFAIGTLLAAGVGAYYLIFPVYVSQEHPEQGEGVRVSAGLGGITIDGTF
jgi:hypothetical protein